MKTEVDIWEVRNGNILKLKYENTIFIPEHTISFKPKKTQTKQFSVDEDIFILSHKNNQTMTLKEIAPLLNRTYESIKSRHKTLRKYMKEKHIPRNWIDRDKSEFFSYSSDKIIEPRIVRVRRRWKHNTNKEPKEKGELITKHNLTPIYKNIVNDILYVMSCHGFSNRDIKDAIKNYYPNNKNNTLDNKCGNYRNYIKIIQLKQKGV